MPLPPRLSAPDLPPRLGRAVLQRHGEVREAAIVDLEGTVDAAHSYTAESSIATTNLESLDLTGAGLTDVDITDLRATMLTARESRWQTVRINGGRVATLDLARGELTNVEIRGVRIDYLTLAGASASDVLFVDCVFGAIDAPQSTLTRVAFDGCRADEIDNRGWRVEHLDLRGVEALRYLDVGALRGATLTERQVLALATDFAMAAGVDVRG